MMRTDVYLPDDRRTEASECSAAFAALFDPTTFRHLETIGVGPGWRCWEVGADGTSVVSWMAKKVGPTGRVLATGTDTSRLTSLRPPVEVRAHDITAEPAPAEGFDLVHARLVLAHVPDRDRVLRTMTDALRPGGRLLVEDTDPGLQPLACPDERHPAERLANHLRQCLRKLMADHGADLSWGRRLPNLLRAAGLQRVEADAYVPIASPACAALEAATFRQVRGHLVGAGLATDEEIDQHLAHVAEGGLDLATPPLVSAWGRKP